MERRKAFAESSVRRSSFLPVRSFVRASAAPFFYRERIIICRVRTYTRTPRHGYIYPWHGRFDVPTSSSKDPPVSALQSRGSFTVTRMTHFSCCVQISLTHPTPPHSALQPMHSTQTPRCGTWNIHCLDTQTQMPTSAHSSPRRTIQLRRIRILTRTWYTTRSTIQYLRRQRHHRRRLWSPRWPNNI